MDAVWTTQHLDLPYERTFKDLFIRCRSNDVPQQPPSQKQLDLNLSSINIEKTDENATRLQKRRRARIASNILEFRSSLAAPIRKIPPDVLLDIFSYVTGGEHIFLATTTTRSRFRCVHGPVLRLTWVSSMFRKLIITYPLFWSSLSISFSGQVDDLSVLRATDILTECLSRMGTTVPINLSINISAWTGAVHPGVLNSMNMLARHASRFKTLFLQSNKVECAESLMLYSHQKHSRSAFPLLGELTLVVLDRGRELFKHPRADFPLLHTLELYSLHASQRTNMPSLTRLTIAVNYSGGNLAVLLDSCPRLQTLTVDFIQADKDQILPCLFRHDHLSSLRIRSPQYCTANSLRSLRLPDLTSLSVGRKPPVIVTNVHAMQMFCSSLKTMLVESQCTLQTVELSGFQQESVVSLFQAVRLGSDAVCKLDSESFTL